jgi:hypothetical protein
MAYDVSALSNYTKEQEAALVMESHFAGKTQQLIQSMGIVLTGVKSAEKIPILDTDVVFQAGGTCGFSSSGTTTLSDRTVTIGKIKINESLCPKTLETKATQKKLQAGSRPDSIPFEKEYADNKAAKTAEALETALWQGDTASGTANLARFDGLLKLIDAASPVNGNTGGVTAATGITAANVRTIVDAFWMAIPAALKGKADFRIFMGWDTFELYVKALTDANLFHYAPNQAEGELTIPGTNYRIVAVHGLDSTDRIIGLRMSNVALGVDLENEEEKFEIFYAKEADEVRFVSEFKMGVNVALPGEVVEFTLVP